MHIRTYASRYVCHLKCEQSIKTTYNPFLETNEYPCGLWLEHHTVIIVQQLNQTLANVLSCTIEEAHTGVETSCQLRKVYHVFYTLKNLYVCAKRADTRTYVHVHTWSKMVGMHSNADKRNGTNSTHQPQQPHLCMQSVQYYIRTQ